MVDRLGSGGGLAREAILAAMKSQAKQFASVDDIAKSISKQIEPGQGTDEVSGFAEQLRSQVQGLDAEAKGVADLPNTIVNGDISSFHEVAVQIKKAEFSFRFAMEIRNKLVDAYREVMRMNV